MAPWFVQAGKHGKKETIAPEGGLAAISGTMSAMLAGEQYNDSALTSIDVSGRRNAVPKAEAFLTSGSTRLTRYKST